MDTPELPPPVPPVGKDADLPPHRKRRVREVIGIGGVIVLVVFSCWGAFCATCTATAFVGISASPADANEAMIVGIALGMSAALLLGCYMTSRLLGPAKSEPGTGLPAEMSTEPRPESPAKPPPEGTEAGPQSG